MVDRPNATLSGSAELDITAKYIDFFADDYSSCHEPLTSAIAFIDGHF